MNRGGIEKEDKPVEDVEQAAKFAGRNADNTQQVEQSDTARDAAGESNGQQEVR